MSSAVENAVPDYEPGSEMVGKTVVVNGRNLVVERLIASGGFAQVFLVRIPNTQHASLALKKVYTEDHDTMRAIVRRLTSW